MEGPIKVTATFSKGTVTVDASNEVVSTTLTDEIGTLAAGETVTGTITVTPNEDGTMLAEAFAPNAYGYSFGPNLTTVTATEIAGAGVPVNGSEFSPLAAVPVAMFTHANGVEPPGRFTAAINWGDGTSTAGTVTLAGGVYNVLGTYSYSNKGTYPVTVQVSDGTASHTIHTTAFIQQELLPDGRRGTANQSFVMAIYRDLLHRKVDPAGLATWTASLDAGASRFSVVRTIETSPTNEYRFIKAEELYHQYLHRDADPLGLQGAVQFLAAGGTVEQLSAILAGSPEYFQVRGGSSNAGFLAAFWQDALQRPLDAATQFAELQALAAGITRQQVAAIIFTGNEYALLRSRSFYREFLRRTADPAGQTGLATALRLGLPDDTASALLISSDEYYSKSAT